MFLLLDGFTGYGNSSFDVASEIKSFKGKCFDAQNLIDLKGLAVKQWTYPCNYFEAEFKTGTDEIVTFRKNCYTSFSCLLQAESYTSMPVVEGALTKVFEGIIVLTPEELYAKPSTKDVAKLLSKHERQALMYWKNANVGELLFGHLFD